MTRKTIILGVIGADVHAVGNKILAYAFEEAGFKVINLGVMTSQKDFIDAAVEADAQVIAVSSLYGHGELDCRGLKEKCLEAGLNSVLLYAGGNLVVGKADFTDVERTFKDMGFNRVYPPGTPPETTIADLKSDLSA
ncbi:MAG: methylaspartate mutase subunit S [Candidatus Adiutrix sp.]|jgi:methylaspartate mutase sigma subunit|nr:methylaspartate mutase subunit S [Candidatus Adiutrix sp.]